MKTEQLKLADLRETFYVTDARWIVYQRRNGTVAGCEMTALGEENVARVVKAGGRVIGRASGCSLREALIAAKKKLAELPPLNELTR